MNAFETYIAIIKGYCGPSLLYVAKAFSNGGYIWSPIVHVCICMFALQCSLKLVKLGKKYQCFSYSSIVKHCIGSKGQFLLELMIPGAHFTFTITSIAFLTSSLRQIMSMWVYDLNKAELDREAAQTTFPVGDVRQQWTFGIMCIVVLSSFAMVRNLAVFSFTFLIANSLILLSFIIISGYSIETIMTKGISVDAVPINTAGMWSAVGYSVYANEGIGVLMPIM